MKEARYLALHLMKNYENLLPKWGYIKMFWNLPLVVGKYGTTE